MAITVTFDPPLPSDSPATFNTKAFTLLGDLNDWSTEANSLASTVNSNASSASSSASTATTQASNAATSASNASTSASNASSSASAASTSASNASTSASNASTSATNASNSAIAAAASAASIDPSALPALRPSLLLDFARSRAVDGRITFTRASTATRTNANGLIELVASGAPRIDYDPVTLACKGLLVEESRTNLLTYSEQFDNAAWVKTRSTITANAAVAPDGTVTADKLIMDASASIDHYAYYPSVSFTSGQSYTFTVFAKSAEQSYMTLWISGSPFGGTTQAVRFNLAGVSVVGVQVGTPVASIQSVGNGWCRCSIAVSATSTATANVLVMLSDAASNTLNGDSTSGIYIWGAQLEAGTFATSYIPTTSAQVTRADEVANITGSNFSSWYRADEGTFLAAYDQIADIATGYPRSWSVSDGTDNNYIQNHIDAASNTNVFGMRVGGVTQSVPSAFTSYVGAFTTTAMAYKVANTGFSKDGSAANQSLTTASIPVATRLSIGANPTASALTFLNGHVARLAYYPKRLTNAELQALTA